MVHAPTLQERTYAIVIQGTCEARMESDAKVKMCERLHFISLRPSLGPPYFFCFNALRYLVGLAGVALLCSTVVMIACESIRFFRL